MDFFKNYSFGVRFEQKTLRTSLRESEEKRWYILNSKCTLCFGSFSKQFRLIKRFDTEIKI